MRLIPRIGARHAFPDPPVGAPRTERLAWRLLVALLVVGTVAFLLIWLLFHRLGQTDQRLADAQHGERLLYSQAVQHGASPSTTPPGAPAASAVSGAPGHRGATGAAGRGISRSFIMSGHLMLGYSDGTLVDAGRVVGPRGATGTGMSGKPGKPGASGAAGRGITATQITADGHLVISYSDGTSSDLGSVIGPAGTNGTNGSSGASGEPGFPPSAFTFTVLGSTYSCTPDTPATAGSQPHYSCTQAQPTGVPTP